MHPDVPEWAREILERELADLDLKAFHVLKDSPLQKLGVGDADDATYVVQKTVAGGELYRVARAEAPAPRPEPYDAPRAGAASQRIGAFAPPDASVPSGEPLGKPGLEELEGIGPAHAEALVSVGIPTRGALARADPARIADATGAPRPTIERWQAEARLVELAELTAMDARRLADAGVTDVDDLARRDPEILAERVGVSADRALGWVEAARKRR